MTTFRFDTTVAIAGMIAAAPAFAEVPVPSGAQVSLMETLWQGPEEVGETLLRLRFLSPEIGAGQPYEVAAADMTHLCLSLAMPMMMESGRAADLIMISLAAAPSGFGETDPGLVQFFEAFRPRDGLCEIEDY